MPSLDFSDILSDPDIAGESFSVIRRQEIVDSYGNVSTVNTTFPAVGQITPIGDNSVIRDAAFIAMSNAIHVVTTFRLQGPAGYGGETYQPDVIVWHGGNYIVKTLNELTNYGGGFVEADCMSIDLVSPGPAGA